MKIKKYFIIPAIALLAVSCQDDDINNGGNDSNAAGKEVTFGATLGESTLTRTSYGELKNGEYPIYWVEGDEVIVTSPECGAESANGGVGSATYSVSVDAANQNYASSLTKTGDIGVRWGENETGTFYSVYPADNASFGSDYTTVTLTMPQQQDCDYTDASGAIVVYPDMDACFMYAKTEDVANGETVNLKYIPISTAIRFTLNGPTSGDAVTVSNIYLYAPDDMAISGEFTIDLSGEYAYDNETRLDSDNDNHADQVPKLVPVSGRTSNYVSINAAHESTGGYLTLGANEKAEINVFFLLEEKTSVNEYWYIEIQASDGTTYTKKLQFTSGDELVPGEVHELPELPALNSPDWDPANWMKNLPRNVYLSEISIPGSWNSMNYYFQPSGTPYTATSIEAQYNAGARAFHIDTRWQGSVDWYIIGYSYNIGALGVADGGDTDYARLNNQGKVMSSSSNPTFESVLTEITSHVQSDEYMVVYCTFAQDSYDYQTRNGGWEYAISTACASNTAVIDARYLDENSVVADVLGKVIVIINTDETVTNLGLSGSKCLFMTDMDMTLTQSTYQAEQYTETTLAYGSGSTCVSAYGTHAQVTATSDYTTGYDTGDRGYAPSFSERETKAGNILTWSQENHNIDDDYAHNTWFYLGLGGYTADSDGDETGDDPYGAVAEVLNPWIEDQVDAMETSSYYPVGIVLMNDVINYSEVMEKILKLNNIYRKAYDSERSQINGDSTNSTRSVSSAARGYSSGMTDNNTNVISWD